LGLKIEYKVQQKPGGLAEAFIIGEEFINGEKVAMILGDNVFYGQGFTPILKEASSIEKGAMIFGYFVKNPSEFGVVEFDKSFNVISLEEKPENPRSKYAIPGLYFYDENVVELAKNLEPSSRGELEITDLNRRYLNKGELRVKILGRGFAWLDTGTCDGLLEASNFVGTIQKRQGLYIACLEEIAYNLGYIDRIQLLRLAESMNNTDYGSYLKKLKKDDGVVL
jgi:glucose-1-phosphate thymidylyltransferase